MEPMGFREPIVLLTGAHFHFAGFALPILTGLAGGTLQNTHARLAVAGGWPRAVRRRGIAVGKSVPVVELSAAWFLAITGLLVVWLQWELAVRTTGWPERLLFGLSGLALLAGISLAAVSALSTFQGEVLAHHPADDPLARHAERGSWVSPCRDCWRGTSPGCTGTELQMVLPVLGEVSCLDEWEKHQLWPGSREWPCPGRPAGTNTSVMLTPKRQRTEPDGPFFFAATSIMRDSSFRRHFRAARQEPVR